MKKLILAVLFSVLVFTFGACASKAATVEPVPEETAVEAEAEVEVEVAAEAEAAE